MKNKKRLLRRLKHYLSVSFGDMRVMCLGTVIILLMTSSGYLFFENQDLEGKLIAVTHEAEMLDAEVPDPILKYAPLLINMDDPAIMELAASLGGPEAIYLFVRDNIEYSKESTKQRSSLEVLETGNGDCLGHADLLAGLLLAYGYPEEDVRVSMGYVTKNGDTFHHAWVEFKNNGKWMALDSSGYLGTFEFDTWDLPSFYFKYNAKPYMEFNNVFVEISRDEHSHMKIRHS